MDKNFDNSGNEDDLFYDRLSKLYEVSPEDLDEKGGEEKKRYTDEVLIASGGVKQIFRAYDQKIGRYVAFACLKKGSPKDLVEPFFREAKLTAKLDHPNIISIFDFGEDMERGPYFTMELKTGISFREFLKRTSKEKSIRDGLEVLVKVCDAMSYAHSKNVLHLDLKPDNIEIGEYGEVIVCDWGCGKIVGHEEKDDLDDLIFNPDLLNQMTLVGKIRGTPGYMAPEQIEKGCEKVFQTDIYALGVMLFEIVYKKSMYEGTQDERMEKTVRGEIIYPDTCSDPALNSIVSKACAIKPEDRYKSVREFRQEIWQYLRGYSPEAENASLFKLVYLFYKRNKALCVSSILFITILMMSTIWYIINLNKSRKVALEAKVVAEQQRKTALIYRSEAEKQLDILKSTKLKYSAELHEDSRLLKSYFFENPQKEIRFSLNKVNKALSFDPNNPLILRDKANLLFLTQNFEGAYKLYQKIKLEDSRMFILSKKFKSIPKHEGNLLSLEDLATIIYLVGEKSWHRHFAEKILAYDYQVRKVRGDYSECVAALVKRYRKTGSKFEFHYDDEKQSLVIEASELSGLRVKDWGSGLCLLRFLKIVDLDISGTKIVSLEDLKGMDDLKTLNISNTSIQDLMPLYQTKLETLKVSDGQFSSTQINYLSEDVNVVKIN